MRHSAGDVAPLVRVSNEGAGRERRKQRRHLLRRRFRFVGGVLPILGDRFPVDVAFGAGPNGPIIRVVRLRTLVFVEIVHSHERRRQLEKRLVRRRQTLDMFLELNQVNI